MSHKVHPRAYRLKKLADWNSRWLNRKKFTEYLEDDFKIRDFLKKKIGKFGVEKIEIERFAGRLNVIIFSAKPGLIIGRGGSGVEELRKMLQAVLNKKKPLAVKGAKSKTEIRIEIREIKDVWSSASLTGQYIAQQIEKRLPFRRVLKQSLDKVMSSRQVKGARIEVSGRLNGTEIARREWLQKGRLPRQTLRADIDFAVEEAHCTYGTIGIKVWIYKGEKFEE